MTPFCTLIFSTRTSSGGTSIWSVFAPAVAVLVLAAAGFADCGFCGLMLHPTNTRGIATMISLPRMRGIVLRRMSKTRRYAYGGFRPEIQHFCTETCPQMHKLPITVLSVSLRRLFACRPVTYAKAIYRQSYPSCADVDVWPTRAHAALMCSSTCANRCILTANSLRRRMSPHQVVERL